MSTAQFKKRTTRLDILGIIYDLLKTRGEDMPFQKLNSLEDKSLLRWQKLMKQVNMTSLGDDAHETRTIACSPQTWLANDGGLEQSAHADGDWCCDVNVCLLWRESEVSNPKCEVQKLWQDWTSRGGCADNVRNLLASQVPRAAVARVLRKEA